MPSLTEFLSAGGRLHFDVHRELIDAVSAASTWTDDERADRATKARYDYNTLADGGEIQQGRHLTPEQRTEAAQASRFVAEYLEAWPDPATDRLIHAALPEPLSVHLEARTRPHRTRIGEPDCNGYWSCDNCGATFAAGEAEALLISDRAGHSRLHRDIALCRDCVVIAAAALGGTDSGGI